MPENPIPRWPRFAVLLALLIAASMTYYHLGVFIPHAMEGRAAKGLDGGYSFGNDFYPIWLTSREALYEHRNPYSPETTREIQTGLFGHALDGRNPLDLPSDYRAFAYPAYVDLMFWPVAWLPFPAVRIVLALTFAALTALSVPLWLRALGYHPRASLVVILILLALSSYAVLEGLFAVQVGLLVGFLLAASFAALMRGKLFLAGSLIAFTFIKPQVSALVAVYLLLWSFSRWHERRSFTYGLLAWSGLLGGLSVLVWPLWIPQWLHVLSGYGSYAPPPLITYSLGPRLGPTLGPVLIVALLMAALILMWRMRSYSAASPAFMLTVSLLFALTSITLLPGQAVYDHVILLPGILLTVWEWRRLAASSRAFAVVLAAAALALFWQWIIVVPLLAIWLFETPQTFFANGLWLLPFHAAASVPLAIAAVLGFMMWEAMRDDPVLRRKEVSKEIP